MHLGVRPGRVWRVRRVPGRRRGGRAARALLRAEFEPLMAKYQDDLIYWMPFISATKLLFALLWASHWMGCCYALVYPFNRKDIDSLKTRRGPARGAVSRRLAGANAWVATSIRFWTHVTRRCKNARKELRDKPKATLSRIRRRWRFDTNLLERRGLERRHAA